MNNINRILINNNNNNNNNNNFNLIFKIQRGVRGAFL